jgi:hypothetical protein
MPTQIALRLPQDLEQKVADSIADTVERSINAPYHLIGGFLVNANQLNDVMAALINDYTVKKLQRGGELVGPDLMEFERWVADQYPPFIVAD